VWQGSTVGVAYGGTGVTSSSGANSVMIRDANQNVSINRLNQTSNTITASGGTTTLTAASAFSQILNGTGGQTFKLPDATTLTNTTTFEFNNNATGTLTITDYANATVGTISSGGAAAIALLSNGTVGGTWDVHAYIPESVTWGTNSLVLGSTVITGGTWNGGTIATGYGGTGLTSYTSGGAVYANSSSTLTSGTLPITAGGTGATTAAGAQSSLNVPSTTGSGASGTWGINITGSASGSAGSVANAVTFNNGGSGDASGTTFNGSAARTISYNTVGAPSTTGTNASGTWGISVTGNAGTAGYILNTNIGRTGSNGFISTTSWGTADWANQPVSGLGMTIANTPGAPNANYGFFNKFGNRDAGGPGWGGMWMEFDGGSLWYGATVVSTSYAGWKKVLDTSNYNSYAPTLTGTGATGTWAINISGNAATATTAANYLPLSGGTVTGAIIVSTSATSPDNNTPTGLSYSRVQGHGNFHINADTDGSTTEYVYITAGFGTANSNAANGLAIGYSTLTWKNNVILHAGNYNSYAPTLTGTGASGTWGINITGSASGNVPSSGGTMTGNLAFTQPYGLSFANGQYIKDNGAGGLVIYSGAQINLNGTYTTATGSVRAPIFYDSDNTAYYVDPASTSNLNTLNSFTMSGGALITFADSGTSRAGLYGTMGTNDQWYITGYAIASNQGVLDIGTGDDAQGAGTAEVIMFTQYGPGTPWSGTVNNRAFIFTESGHTTFPGNLGIGMNKTAAPYSTTSPVAPLQVVQSTPTTIGSIPSGVTMVSDSASNNYLLFRNSADNGTYGGIAFQDNNIGGYVIFGNAGGGGDQLWVAGYGGGALQYGTANSISPGARTTVASWNSTGLQINSGDMRAPIYYDSDNTGYYANPASTSQLSTVLLNAGLGASADGVANDPYGFISVSRSSAANYSYYGLTRVGQFVVGMGIDTSNYFWIGGVSSGYNGVRTSTSFYMNTSGDTWSTSSSRAPIFYDSNDTSYYLDPNGTSVLNVLSDPALSDSRLYLRTRGDTNHYLWNAGDDWEELVAYSGTGFRVTNSNGTGSILTCYGNINGNYVQAVGSMRAPIFYDSDDTGYYGNFAGTSRFSVARASELQFIDSSSFAFGSFWAGGAGYPGYQYIGGNNRFGFSSTSGYIDVYTDGNYYGGIDLYGANRLVPLFDANQGGGALYSSIFYDTNDTSYYCDPNGTSRLNTGYFVNNITVSAGNTTGNGIILADDGDIVDLNDGYCSMRFSYGVRIFSANRGGSAQVALTYQGNVIAAGNVTAYGSPSDIRLKENVKPLTGALDKVMQLQGCTFDWKEDSEQHTMVGLREDIGFIANDVKDVVPNMVRMGQDGYLSLRDRGFSALLVEAMKEQQVQIAALRAEINALRAH
jgi:hypothetical protein